MDPQMVLQYLVAFVVLVFSIIVHENAHGLAAERFGDPTARLMGRITMNPLPHIDPIGSVVVPVIFATMGGAMFGWAKPVPVNSANLRNPIVHNAYVAAAGPASNFLLALLGTLLYIIVGLVYKHSPALHIGAGNSWLFFEVLCVSLIRINCVLGIFNLIPIPPLDGHWILFRYLPPRYAAVLAAIRPYGFIILILLVISPIPILWWIIRFPLYIIAGNLVSFAHVVLRAL